MPGHDSPDANDAKETNRLRYGRASCASDSASVSSCIRPFRGVDLAVLSCHRINLGKPSVSFEHVTKRFGDATIVEDFTLDVADGELLVLVGGSGSGKSTILRMLAGLETVTSGTIRIDGRDVTALPPRDRDVAMVFQDYALYPHMTVRENLSLGLRLNNVPRPDIDRRIAWAGGILGLERGSIANRSSSPGGQRQRVAMGSAMVARPKVFLFDEPLSNLDAAFAQDAHRSEAFSAGEHHHRVVTHDQSRRDAG